MLTCDHHRRAAHAIPTCWTRMNTRTIAVVALIIAVIVLLIILL